MIKVRRAWLAALLVALAACAAPQDAPDRATDGVWWLMDIGVWAGMSAL